MAEPIIIEGPDGNEYEFPQGTDEATIKGAMAKQFPKGWAPEPSAAAGTYDFKTGASDFSAMPQGQGLPDAQKYLLDQATADPETTSGGIRSSADAALFNLANTALSGQLREAGNKAYEGTSQGKYGDKALTTGELDYPTASMIGRGVGFAYGAGGPTAAATHTVENLATKAGIKLAGTGSNVVPRLARYGVRTTIGAPLGATEMAAFDAISEAPTQSFMQGNDPIEARWKAPLIGETGVSIPRFRGSGSAAVHAMNPVESPMNYGVGPAASVVGRTGRAALKGSPTFSNVQESVYKAGGPVPLENNLSRNIGRVLNAEAVNLLDPRAVKLTERIFKNSGLSPDDIVALNERAGEIVKASQDGAARRLTIGQIYTQALYEMDKPQAAENLVKVLRERRNATKPNDRSPSIVGETVNDLRSSQVPFLNESLGKNLGAGRSLDTVKQADIWEEALGKQYEAIFAPGASAPEPGSMDALTSAINFWRNESAIMKDAQKIATEAARRDGIPYENALEHYIQTDPRRAAHWMKSAAGALKRAEEGAPSPNDITAKYWDNIEKDLAGKIDSAAPGYKDVRTSFAQTEGVRRATDFGDRFLTMAAGDKKSDRFIDDFKNLSDTEQEYALESIREALAAPLRGGGEDMPARLARLNNIGTLDLLEQLGPKGKAVADDIRAVGSESQYLNMIDTGNPARQSATFSNLDAKAEGPGLYSGPVSNAIGGTPQNNIMGDVFLSHLAGAPIPLFSSLKLATKGLENIVRPSTRSREAMTELLMRRPHAGRGQNALAQPSAPPPSGGPPKGVSPGWQGGNALASDTSGSAHSGFTTDLAASAAGSVGGSVYGSQNDLNGDGVIDERDAQMGALGGMAAGFAGSRGIKAANNIGRAAEGAAREFRVRPGESGTFNVETRAGGQRWQRDGYPFASRAEAEADIARVQGGQPAAREVDNAVTAVLTAKTPQQFWDNIRTIPEGPQRDQTMQMVLKRAKGPEERGKVLDMFMGAASDWGERERIARQLLRDSPTDWQSLRYAWPGSDDPAERLIDGVPAILELVQQEAPGLTQTVLRTPSPVAQALRETTQDLTGLMDEMQPRLATDGGKPVPTAPNAAPEAPGGQVVPFKKPPNASGVAPMLRYDAANALVGAGVGSTYPDLNHDGKITMQERLIGAGIGAAGAVAGTRIGTEGNYFSRSGAGGRKPPKLPTNGYDNLRIGSASVEVTRGGDKMTINRIAVPDGARGNGQASRALDQVLQQADNDGLTVFLTADPIGSGGLSKAQLEAFYKRHGFVNNSGRNKDFSSQAGMVRPPRPPISSAGYSGGRKPPKLPKLKSDVPLGTPPKGPNPKLGQGNIIREGYQGKGNPRLPKGPMTQGQLAARKKRETVLPLLEQGLSNEAVRKQTGIPTFTYQGKTVLLPDFMKDTKSDTITELFYKEMSKPFEQRKRWVQDIIRATADSEETALAAQRRWDEKNPLMLGTDRTPMVKPGNALADPQK